MSNHVNAPATNLVAVRCCVCRQALVDALSVECGIGPVCREKWGFVSPDGAVSMADALVWIDRAMEAGEGWIPSEKAARAFQSDAPDARIICNSIVHSVACDPHNDVRNEALCLAIMYLGFATLAWRLAINLERFAQVKLAQASEKRARTLAGKRLAKLPASDIAKNAAFIARVEQLRAAPVTVAALETAAPRIATVTPITRTRPAGLIIVTDAMNGTKQFRCESLSDAQFQAYRSVMTANYGRHVGGWNVVPAVRSAAVWAAFCASPVLAGVVLRSAKGDTAIAPRTAPATVAQAQ